MKNYVSVSIFFLSIHVCISQHFLNGDFEINNGGSSNHINLSNTQFNNMVPYVTSFGTWGPNGSGQLDLITYINSACGNFTPQHGNWCIAMTDHSDRLSLETSSPLIAGYTYMMSFYYRVCDTSHVFNISIGLSTIDTLVGTNVYVCPYPDTIWQNITFSFVAPFNASYITLSDPTPDGGYIFLDNFMIENCLQPVELGNDTILCDGDQWVLNAQPNPNWSYLWQDSSTSSSYVVENEGVYTLQAVTQLCGTDTDTIQIFYEDNPIVDLGDDTLLCIGETILLEVIDTPTYTYLWQDSSLLNYYEVVEDGYYSVAVNNAYCATVDSILVEYIDIPLDVGNDISICKREITPIGNQIDVDGIKYVWNTMDTSRFISVNDTGNYFLNAFIDRCVKRDTIHVAHYIPSDAYLEAIDKQQLICVKDTLKASYSNWNDSYLWNTGDTTPFIIVDKPGNYEVNIINACMEVANSFEVTIETLTEGQNDYNIITPNNDGQNEYFSIYTGNSTDYFLSIYNRWGRKIWESNTPLNHWNGENISDGVYFYHCSFKNCQGEMIDRKGTVTLVR